MKKHRKTAVLLAQADDAPRWSGVLDQLRVLQGLRLCDLGHKCQTIPSHLKKILSGQAYNTGIRTLVKICDTLGCSMDYALHATDVSQEVASESLKIAAAYEKKKLRWWQFLTRLNRRTRSMILGCAELARRQGRGSWRGH